MRIGALLGVKDEAELIGACVRQLWAIGVDVVICRDMGSTDGTVEILESLSGTGEVRVLHIDPRDAFDPTSISLRKVEMMRQADADWVLFLDADEFWVPASGRLRDVSAIPDNDILRVDRLDVPLGRAGPLMPGELSPPHYEGLLVRIPEVADPGQGFPGPKVMARPEVVEGVRVGDHNVNPVSPAARRDIPRDLLVAHVPFTSWTRFERKVTNIHAFLQAHPDYFASKQALRWKRWAVMWEQGTLEEEFERQRIDEDSLGALRNAGTIRSVADLFDERNRPHIDARSSG